MKHIILAMTLLLLVPTAARADYCSSQLTGCLERCQSADDWAVCNERCSREFAQCRARNRGTLLDRDDSYECYADACRYNWTRQRHEQCNAECEAQVDPCIQYFNECMRMCTYGTTECSRLCRLAYRRCSTGQRGS